MWHVCGHVSGSIWQEAMFVVQGSRRQCMQQFKNHILSSREGINSHCRRFDLLLFAVLAQSDRSCRHSGCRRSDGLLAINHDRSYRPFSMGRCRSTMTAVTVHFRWIAVDQPRLQLPPLFDGSLSINRDCSYRPFSMGRCRSTMTAVTAPFRWIAVNQPWPQLPPLFDGSLSINHDRSYRPFSMGRCRSTMTAVTVPFRWIAVDQPRLQLPPLFDGSLSINRDRTYWRPWFIQLNIRSATRFRDSCWVFFAHRKVARPNWDANAWERWMPGDTNSLRYIPRRSSKNCDMQYANSDRQI